MGKRILKLEWVRLIELGTHRVGLVVTGKSIVICTTVGSTHGLGRQGSWHWVGGRRAETKRTRVKMERRPIHSHASGGQQAASAAAD